MEQYISKEFPDGASVEAALLRAKSGGAIDIALQEKAPGGYGLGGGAKFITSGSLNDYKNCGWYAWDEGVSNVPFAYGSCIILNKGGDWIVHQIAIAGYGQNICIRRYVNPTDSWDAWEWVNPPMQLGVEYRTTERYHGKPVYVKLVDFGKLPNTASKYVDPNISNFEKLIEPMTVTIYRSDTSVHGTPMVEDTKTYARSWFKMAAGGVVIRTMIDLSADSAVVKLKYTKTTD